MMTFNDEFIKLIKEIRNHRANIKYCISAQNDINVKSVIIEFCENDFYKEDYQTITSYFVADFVSYEDVIGNMKKLAKCELF